MNQVSLKAKKAAYMREYWHTHPEAREKRNARVRAYYLSPAGQLASKKHAEKQKLQGRNRVHQRVWKMTDGQLEKLYIEHNHLCAICQHKKVLVIDHDHKTNKIRGLLCNECNTGLGFFQDKIQFLEKAIQYLTRNQEG